MTLHAFFVLAGNEQAVVSKSVRLAETRLRLPNGEVKIPHGGLSLLCQVDGHAGGVEVQGHRVNLVGRALLRGPVRTPTGHFTLGATRPGTPETFPYSLQTVFRSITNVAGLRVFRDAHVAEFVVTGLTPADDPCWLLADPGVLQELERLRMRQGYRENEMTTDELVELLGGSLAADGVRFTSEGAFSRDA